MACPSSMASERKPPELTPSTTFDNISQREGHVGSAPLQDYWNQRHQTQPLLRLTKVFY